MFFFTVDKKNGKKYCYSGKNACKTHLHLAKWQKTCYFYCYNRKKSMSEERDIGQMVRFHRKKARITQAELAKLSGVGKTAVFDIEQGKESVRLSTLMKVLYTLNMSISFNGPLMHLFREQHEKS